MSLWITQPPSAFGSALFGDGGGKVIERRRADHDDRDDAAGPARRIREAVGRIPEARAVKPAPIPIPAVAAPAVAAVLAPRSTAPVAPALRLSVAGAEHRARDWRPERCLSVSERGLKARRKQERDCGGRGSRPHEEGNTHGNISGAATASLTAMRPRSRWSVLPRVYGPAQRTTVSRRAARVSPV